MKGYAKLFLFAIAVFIIFILISAGQSRLSQVNLGIVREGYARLVWAVSSPVEFCSGIWTNYIYLVNTRQEKTELEKKLARLEVENMTLKELRSENIRMRAMLEFSKTYVDTPLYPAEVIAQDLSLLFKTVMLDKGKVDGFFTNMPIIQPDGLIGRTIGTSPHSSQVLLITDVNSSVPAITENGRVKGIVKGRGDGNLSLEYVRSDEDIRIGDLVVTSGLGGIFVKGLNIGTVRSIKRHQYKLFAEITVYPSVEIGKIEEVFGVGSDVADTH